MFSRRGGERAASAEPPALPQRTDVVAVFDLEGTVVDSNIVQQYLWVRSRTAGASSVLARVRVDPRAAARLPRAERRDRGEFIRTFLRRYEGMPVGPPRAARARRLRRHAARAHQRRRRCERVQEHRDAGHRTVLVTGSIGMLAEPLAALFDEVVAEHDARGGRRAHRYLGGRRSSTRPGPPGCATTPSAGLDLASPTATATATPTWSGSRSSAPHAVNPDTQLAREALRRRWPILEWRRGGVSRTTSTRVSPADAVALRLRAAGSVFAEDEARLLLAEAASPRAWRARRAARRGRAARADPRLGGVRRAPLVVDPGCSCRVTAPSCSRGGRPRCCQPDGVVVDLCCGAGALGVARRARLAGLSNSTPRTSIRPPCAAPAPTSRRRRGLPRATSSPRSRKLRGRMDVLAANAPYVPTGAIALDAARGARPRARSRSTAERTASTSTAASPPGPRWLAPGGAVLIEAGGTQAAGRPLLSSAGLAVEVEATTRSTAPSRSAAGRPNRSGWCREPEDVRLGVWATLGEPRSAAALTARGSTGSCSTRSTGTSTTRRCGRCSGSGGSRRCRCWSGRARTAPG